MKSCFCRRSRNFTSESEWSSLVHCSFRYIQTQIWPVNKLVTSTWMGKFSTTRVSGLNSERVWRLPFSTPLPRVCWIVEQRAERTDDDDDEVEAAAEMSVACLFCCLSSLPNLYLTLPQSIHIFYDKWAAIVSCPFSLYDGVSSTSSPWLSSALLKWCLPFTQFPQIQVVALCKLIL